MVGNGTVDYNTAIGIQTDQKGTTNLNSLSVQDNGDIFYGEFDANNGFVGQRDDTTGEQEAVFEGYDVADVASEGNTTYFLETDGDIYEIDNGTPILLGSTSAGSTELKIANGVAYTLDTNGDINNFSTPVLTGLNLNGFESFTVGSSAGLVGISDTGIYEFGIGDTSPTLLTSDLTGHKIIYDPISGYIVNNTNTGELLKYNPVTEETLLLGTGYYLEDMEGGFGVTYYADGLVVDSIYNQGGNCLNSVKSTSSTCSTPYEVNALITLLTDNCISDSLLFDLNTNGDTIRTECIITVSDNVVVQGNGINNTIISGEQMTEIFYVPTGVTLTLKDMTLTKGKDSFLYDGGAIHNNGTLILENVVLKDNLEGSTPKALTNNGTLSIKSDVTIIE